VTAVANYLNEASSQFQSLVIEKWMLHQQIIVAKPQIVGGPVQNQPVMVRSKPATWNAVFFLTGMTGLLQG